MGAVVSGSDWPAFGLAIALLANLLLVGLWDAAAAFGLVASPSVSSIINRWASEFPSLGIAVGYVMGHLFWPLKK